MIRSGLAGAFGPAIGALAVLTFLPAAANGCPAPSDTVLFHSCWGTARAQLLLLPEEAEAIDRDPPPGGRVLMVTAGYTGTDTRDEGRPNPVGLFVHDRQTVNPTLARMDGIVGIGADGGIEIGVRGAARIGAGGPLRDLSDPAARADFRTAAAEAGVDVFQSHLLIRDGDLDLSDLSDAPRFQRRILFTDQLGWGVYQTIGALTLYDAALGVKEALAPHMAVNLDMGSFDYCWRIEDGAWLRCGLLGRGDTGQLSSLLRLTLD